VAVLSGDQQSVAPMLQLGHSVFKGVSAAIRQALAATNTTGGKTTGESGDGVAGGNSVSADGNPPHSNNFFDVGGMWNITDENNGTSAAGATAAPSSTSDVVTSEATANSIDATTPATSAHGACELMGGRKKENCWKIMEN
jgi:hypothetical protein